MHKHFTFVVHINNKIVFSVLLETSWRSLYSQTPGMCGHSRETMRPLFKWASSSPTLHLLSMSNSLAQLSFLENVKNSNIMFQLENLQMPKFQRFQVTS